MQTAVVTGVSTGIGWGATKVLIGKGWTIYGSVRKAVDAERLKAEFGERFRPLLFDVTDEAAVLAAADAVRTELKGAMLQGLVNNAGIAVAGPALMLSVEDFRRQIEVNLIGPFAVTRAFAPLLGADPALQGPKGRIVNISSVGGKLGAPFLSAYVASKHGIEGFSESFRREMMLFGIDVIVVGPGAVATPIWDKAEDPDDPKFRGTVWAEPLKKFVSFFVEEGRKGLAPEVIGEVVLEALTAPRPKVRYAPVRGKFFNYTLPSLLPKRWVDRLIGKRTGLLPP
jgi:NAD(P)-dependent dehydrogenase (short-subunit alcohol dehydrogenase family)